MPRAAANGGVTGGRNKSVNQYGACHAVECRSPPVFVSNPLIFDQQCLISQISCGVRDKIKQYQLSLSSINVLKGD
jgi:hypothetical protein